MPESPQTLSRRIFLQSKRPPRKSEGLPAATGNKVWKSHATPLQSIKGSTALSRVFVWMDGIGGRARSSLLCSVQGKKARASLRCAALSQRRGRTKKSQSLPVGPSAWRSLSALVSPHSVTKMDPWRLAWRGTGAKAYEESSLIGAGSDKSYASR